MKKALVLIAFAFALCGCSGRITVTKDFVFLERQGLKTFTMYDKQTKVMYIGYTMGGYCPMYNADGTLKLYEEE